jgi:two-component system, NtrC family, response regulator PilR
MDKPTVLIVDDEPDLLELVSLTLERMKLTPVCTKDLASARRLLGERHFDLCLTDMRLPDGDGLDLVAWIEQHQPQLPVAVITAHGNVESAVRALKAGAFDFVSKPLDLSVLRRLVSSAIRLGSTSDTDATARRGPRLLGGSASMNALRALIARVARSQAPVHIAGESGTGKELVARLIHDGGARRDGPFVPVNCGAIPTELMESELFGHKRGSFTGAVADKRGLLQSAEGGTLFLDEVADLPLHMQVKLLRVIQEKSVRPIGEQREQPIDVRVLSATHKNLAELVANGRFREDLFYRINVIEIRVSALREHAEDIPELAEAMLRRLGRRLGGAVPTLSTDALTTLANYGFPGNVRELENILERALTLSTGLLINPEDLQLRAPIAARGAAHTTVTTATSGGAAAHAAPSTSPDHLVTSNGTTTGAEPLGHQLEHIERDAILKALEQTRYNKTAAAKLLGMTFRALRYRVKKLGIE